MSWLKSPERILSRKPKASVDELTHYAADEVFVESSDLSAVATLLRYGKGFYARLAGSIVLILSSSAFLMFSARALGGLVEELTGSADAKHIAWLAMTILCFEATHIALTYFGRVSLALLTNRIAYRLRLDMFRKVTLLPISYFDRQPLGRTITRLTNDIEGIERFFTGPLARVLASFITIGSVLAAMLVTNLRLGIVVVVSSLPALIFTFLMRGPVQEWLRAYKIRSSGLNSRLAELINGFPIIRIFGLESWAGESFSGLARQQRDAGISLLNWNSFIRPTAAFFCSLPMAVILWWGGRGVLDGALSLGLVVAFVRYAERFYWPVMAISQEINVIQEAIASSERVRQMLEEPEEEVVLGKDGDFEAPIEGHVSFQSVWMGYDATRPVLKGVSFDVVKGMTVGLVGETGSGKTSTVNLIPYLYAFSKGDITIDGMSIRNWKRGALRSQIGMVSQDIVMFRGTLRENLLIAAPSPEAITDEKLMAYCRKTGLDHVMSRFPKGMDTMILDGGDNLSVGERQLVAFTRMLVRDPAIFILDEATANIDEECERLVQRAIEEVMKDRTCFVIAHRLNTILQCEQILVFDRGQIIESGNHEELMASQGRYYALAQTQLAEAH